jgi:competence protein ComEA
MREEIEARLRALARRAGWAGAPPAVVAAGLALACVAVGVALWRWWPGADAGVGSPSRAEAGGAAAVSRVATPSGAAGGVRVAEGAPGGAASATVCVHVVGAVRHPGVYELSPGTRVAAALEAAGGALDDAATEAINLAAKVEDGQQVIVPTREQVASGEVPTAASAATDGVGKGGAGGSPAAKVDLNTADAAGFDTLPGVGPSTAAKIVADRETNGRFKTVEELGRVAGIGPKKLEALKDLVVVR